MTLRYWLTGRPGNIREFAAKLKKKGITRCSIHIVSKNIPPSMSAGHPGGTLYFIVVKDASEKIQYKDELVHVPSAAYFGSTRHYSIDYKKPQKLAEYLKREGFDVRVYLGNDTPISTDPIEIKKIMLERR